MRRIITYLLFAFIGISSLQAQWHEFHTGVTEDLFDVFCIDANTAFVCGQNGVILKTEDGGETWVEKNRTEGLWLHDIRFLDNIGYANADGFFLKTTDGGETWQPLSSKIDSHLPEAKSDYDELIPSYDLFLVDTDTLYAYYGCLNKSVDSGTNWECVDCFILAFNLNTSKIYFEDNVGYIVSCNDEEITVWKSVDYGNTWDIVWQNIDEEGYGGPWGFAVHFIDKDNVKIFPCYMPMGRNYPITDFYAIVTNDGFETYSIEPVENNGYYGSITGSKFTDANNGCYIAYQEWYGSDCKGCGRHIDEQNFACITKDGGQTWQFCYDGIDGGKSLYGIDGIDTTYYIAAQGGYVYRTGTPETIYEWINDPESIDENKELLTITPNPVKDKFTIEGENIKTIEIHDMTGRKVLSQKCNSDKVTIDFCNLHAGVYACIIQGEGYNKTEKIVITK